MLSSHSLIILNELKELGYFSKDVEVRGANIYADGDTYVYSTTMYSGENSKVVNIIERYPYDYEIVFDDFYSYEKRGTSYTNESIKFTIDDVYRNLKYIEFNWLSIFIYFMCVYSGGAFKTSTPVLYFNSTAL